MRSGLLSVCPPTDMSLRLWLFALLLVGCPDTERITEAQACDACEDSCSLETVEFDTAVHTEEPIEWGTSVPVGGPHDPCWADWAIYDTPLPPRHWVHNLEHGGIVYLYDCPEGCPDELSILEGLHAANEAGTVIVTPYEGLPTQFAAVAWGKRLMLGCADSAALQQFHADHVDRAPESVTSGAPVGCME